MAERSRHKSAKSGTRTEQGKIRPKKSSANAERPRQQKARGDEGRWKGGARRGEDVRPDRSFRSGENLREEWEKKRPRWGDDAGRDRSGRSRKEGREDRSGSRPGRERGEMGGERPFRPKRSADGGEWKDGARGRKNTAAGERSQQRKARGGEERWKGSSRRGGDVESDRSYRSGENLREEWEKKRPRWGDDGGRDRSGRPERERREDRGGSRPGRERGEMGGERPFRPKRSADGGEWKEGARGRKNTAAGERSQQRKARGGEEYGRGGARRGEDSGSDRPKRWKEGGRDERENKRPRRENDAGMEPSRRVNREERGERRRDYPGKERGEGERASFHPKRSAGDGRRKERPRHEAKDPIGERPVRQKKSIREEKGKIRLNKAIADAGIVSRRKADEMIAAGEVRVNGTVVQELGRQVERSDTIEVRGKLIGNPNRERYILLNKPKDTITTTSDERGRRTVIDLIEARERLFPVGRLDRNTTGVLLLTNDGDMAYRLTHPSYEIERVYEVVLDKEISLGDARAIAQGVPIGKGETSLPCYVSVEDGNRQNVTVVIREGKNREVRRMFEARDYQVKKLNRVSYAGLTYQGLQRGEWRELKKHEVRELRKRLKLD